MTLNRLLWCAGTFSFAVALTLLVTALWSYRAQAAVLRADPELILATRGLRETALSEGRGVYQRNCAGCHGRGGKGDGALGVPDLTRGRHLYGVGRVAEIEEIARHGIRSLDKRGFNLASMPVFASAHPYKGEPLPSLTPGQIEDLTQYVLAFSGRATDTAAVSAGGVLFKNQAGCWDCHGQDARGDPSIGAPSLLVDHWLYGQGSHDDIYRSIAKGRAGFSPAFQRRLNAAQLRDVAVYMASLGPKGGRVDDQ